MGAGGAEEDRVELAVVVEGFGVAGGAGASRSARRRGRRGRRRRGSGRSPSTKRPPPLSVTFCGDKVSTQRIGGAGGLAHGHVAVDGDRRDRPPVVRGRASRLAVVERVGDRRARPPGPVGAGRVRRRRAVGVLDRQLARDPQRRVGRGKSCRVVKAQAAREPAVAERDRPVDRPAAEQVRHVVAAPRQPPAEVGPAGLEDVVRDRPAADRDVPQGRPDERHRGTAGGLREFDPLPQLHAPPRPVEEVAAVGLAEAVAPRRPIGRPARRLLSRRRRRPRREAATRPRPTRRRRRARSGSRRRRAAARTCAHRPDRRVVRQLDRRPFDPQTHLARGVDGNPPPRPPAAAN